MTHGKQSFLKPHGEGKTDFLTQMCVKPEREMPLPEHPPLITRQDSLEKFLTTPGSHSKLRGSILGYGGHPARHTSLEWGHTGQSASGRWPPHITHTWASLSFLTTWSYFWIQPWIYFSLFLVGKILNISKSWAESVSHLSWPHYADETSQKWQPRPHQCQEGSLGDGKESALRRMCPSFSH